MNRKASIKPESEPEWLARLAGQVSYTLESDFEAAFTREISALGFTVRKLKTPGDDGAPDRIITGFTRTAFRELKRKDPAKPDPLQAEYIKSLLKDGQDARCIGPADLITEVLYFHGLRPRLSPPVKPTALNRKLGLS